ncbi:G-protein coupled receptor 183-like [Periophthalmus magnuspinnatus]|uniref:G-protein coupled receptor 183-like n=1 Tax=Periophthalmus magnuspinnatus TaxID=409849 RepID=UPI00145C0B19|nr:G-protein coupled receptor 183-like [Periophthalmus magnuspinnatus]
MEREPSDSVENVVAILQESCYSTWWGQVWFVIDNIVLVTGVLANSVLLVLFLRERKTLSASQVLGTNLVIMNLIYLTIIPLDMITRAPVYSTSNETRARPDVSAIISGNQTEMWNIPEPFDLRRTSDIFILIGIPLLLTCMCIERHLAVSHPVLYMKIREKKYRVMVSVVVWVITVGISATSPFVGNIQILLPVSVIISFLFVVMLLCLGTIVRSLWQTSPAHHDALGNNNRANSPQKRQAVQSLLFVVVSAILVYLPVLALFPFILYIYNNRRSPLSQQAVCNVFQCTVLFPSFGVLIGPLFFFSKAKQMFKFKERSNSG